MTSNMEPPSLLSVADYMAAASAETGLGDFGGSDFLEPFRLLVESTDREAQLNAVGVMAFNADMHRFLVNRLRFAENLRVSPEIAEEDVSDPIVILGLARTGTTKLQRMLSADPGVQRMDFWRLLNPAPIGPQQEDVEDPRIEIARQAAAMAQEMFPRFNAAHPTVAEDVDEELFLTQFSFETIVLYLLNPAHSYYAWIKHRKLDSCYRYLRELTQYLQWQDGGKQGRPWIMKSPLHIGNIDSLLTEFPRATLVHCHRDLTDVIPSFCNLFEAGWQMRTDEVDSHETGSLVLDIWGTEMDKYLAHREKLQADARIIDVPYTRIHTDVENVISEIYQQAGRDLDDDTLGRMNQWLTDNPKNRFGKNQYTMERYGLTQSRIAERFSGYLDMFESYTR